MKFLTYCLLAAVLSVSSAHAQQALKKHYDTEKQLHFGTDAEPNLCCYCVEVVRYEITEKGSVIKLWLQDGSIKLVPSSRAYSSSKPYYCRGVITGWEKATEVPHNACALIDPPT